MLRVTGPWNQDLRPLEIAVRHVAWGKVSTTRLAVIHQSSSAKNFPEPTSQAIGGTNDGPS